jgi:hypothetical protein
VSALFPDGERPDVRFMPRRSLPRWLLGAPTARYALLAVALAAMG